MCVWAACSARDCDVPLPVSAHPNFRMRINNVGSCVSSCSLSLLQQHSSVSKLTLLTLARNPVLTVILMSLFGYVWVWEGWKHIDEAMKEPQAEKSLGASFPMQMELRLALDKCVCLSDRFSDSPAWATLRLLNYSFDWWKTDVLKRNTTSNRILSHYLCARQNVVGNSHRIKITDVLRKYYKLQEVPR